MTTETDPRLAVEKRDRLVRHLASLRSFVRRTDLTGWVRERNANVQYERAYRAIVDYEDLVGVDETEDFGDRLRNLRWEAAEKGLLDPADVGELERRAIASLDPSPRS